MAYIQQAKSTIYGTPSWVINKYLPSDYFDTAPYPWKPDKLKEPGTLQNWDGLRDSWKFDVLNFCNPPFQDLYKGWAKKIKSEALLGKQFFLIMPMRTGAKYTRTELLPFANHIILLPKLEFIDHVHGKHGFCPVSIMAVCFNYEPPNCKKLKCSLSM